MPGMTALRVTDGWYTPECREDGCGWTGTSTYDEGAADREADDHEAEVHGVDHSTVYDES